MRPIFSFSFFFINDLGSTNGDAEMRAKKIIECYKEFIKKAHDRGMKIYGATISAA